MISKSYEQENNQVSLNLPKNWGQILEYGRYAPSPHNMQPWLFRVESEDTVTLLYDPKRLLPGTNPLGSYVQVGFGILETERIHSSNHLTTPMFLLEPILLH